MSSSLRYFASAINQELCLAAYPHEATLGSFDNVFGYRVSLEQMALKPLEGFANLAAVLVSGAHLVSPLLGLARSLCSIRQPVYVGREIVGLI